MTLDIQINLTDQSDINEGKVSHLGFQICLKGAPGNISSHPALSLCISIILPEEVSG